MGQCHIHDGCRYEVSGPDGRMGDDGNCSVPTWRTCFSSGGEWGTVREEYWTPPPSVWYELRGGGVGRIRPPTRRTSKVGSHPPPPGSPPGVTPPPGSPPPPPGSPPPGRSYVVTIVLPLIHKQRR